MEVYPLRSGTPGVRLGLALGASLLLHFAALLPAPWWQWWLPRNSDPLPPLAVLLPPPEPPPVPSAATEPLPAQPTAAGAVSPELTFERAALPRELKGRALNAALEALAREEFYPREAIARGLEGRVVLLLTLDGSGRLVGIEVASSSGHALLDDAALKAATRIGRLAAGQRQVLLPVEFRLE
jgi:periplasmic protein TonB